MGTNVVAPNWVNCDICWFTMERTLISKSGKKLPGANRVQKAPKWTTFFASEILCVSEILMSHCNSASYGLGCFKSPGRTMEGTRR